MGNSRLKTLGIIGTGITAARWRVFGNVYFHNAVLKSLTVASIKVESLAALAESLLNNTSLIRKGGTPSFQISSATQQALMQRIPQTTNFKILSRILTCLPSEGSLQSKPNRQP
jgi:acid phosphatase family membrane protein YuiD